MQQEKHSNNCNANVAEKNAPKKRQLSEKEITDAKRRKLTSDHEHAAIELLKSLGYNVEREEKLNLMLA